MEHVNHPSHYNQHPAGIECIEIIRHYTCDIANAIKYLWRAGLKPEMGMEDAEKEIEDLEKAIFYIEDYAEHGEPRVRYPYMEDLETTIGHTIGNVLDGFSVKDVAVAIGHLLYVGFICNGEELAAGSWEDRLDEATKAIQQRILDIEHQLLNKELENTVQVMNGQAVDGEDYVSKPGCVRETEPEKYDPLNMIILYGTAYCLSSDISEKRNGALRTPCQNCDLQEFCFDYWRHPETSARHNLCRLHQAQTNEYYSEVGKVKYSPRFGTIEVIDEVKELELERKKIEAELNEALKEQD